jgi:hypothetical protein
LAIEIIVEGFEYGGEENNNNKINNMLYYDKQKNIDHRRRRVHWLKSMRGSDRALQ